MACLLMDFAKTKLSWKRPLWDYKKVQLFYSFLIRNGSLQLANRKIRKLEYLNVGCGPNTHPDFINLDYKWRPGVQLCWDITRKLPLPDGSIKGIFTEHCLEHITFAQCRDTLREFHRILGPGGVLRLIVPDAELYIDLYHQAKQGKTVKFPYMTDEDCLTDFSPVMAINRVFQGHGHKFAYDEETLRMLLLNARFSTVQREKFMKGNNDRLLLDTKERAVESLYMEAFK